LLSFLNNQGIVFWIGENVDELSKMSSDNRQHLSDALGEIGFVLVTVLAKSNDFGAATARERCWILALHCGRCGLDVDAARELLNKMAADIALLKMSQLPLSDFLLEPTSEYLSSLLSAAAVNKSRSVASSTDKESNWLKTVEVALW
jgi:site-specific DNA-cytosine methylase